MPQRAIFRSGAGISRGSPGSRSQAIAQREKIVMTQTNGTGFAKIFNKYIEFCTIL
jgi:hypothetical protein